MALYRKYRPGSFAEVVGQDHVTEPLQHALAAGRVHHAYLFSGPRGCGKTSSARILARSLNCAEGPTPTPCGRCESCLALAPNGPGSLDVIEIDAASHGGVDDARDLRERAFFAPVASRFKTYIIDEAHMVSGPGWNALLKLVEEPPEHLVFVFATTEPDKVIGTIRSRTHHYPFRLLPPGVLRDLLTRVCAQEGVDVDPTVLPLVVRAGAGSARDALSVLDQLIAGAGPDGVTYPYATHLLGFTDAELLDEVIDAFAAQDGAAVFEIVDRTAEAGHDPRRFAQDVLERLRDLLVLQAVPEGADRGLVDAPPDGLQRMRAQAVRFGRAELTRAAEVVAAGLTEMKGAVAPRLLLELVCARVLLPGAADDPASLLARVERLERRVALATPPGTGTASPPAAPPAPAPPAAAPPGAAPPAPTGAVPAPPAAPAPAATDGTEPGALDAGAVRRAWPDVLEAVKSRKRATWAMLAQYAQVLTFQGRTLTLGFQTAGIERSFRAGPNIDILREALRDYLAIDVMVETTVSGPQGPPDERPEERPDERGATRARARRGPARPSPADEEPDAVGEGDLGDDPPAPEAPVDPVTLLGRHLGATVIGEVETG
ncbi:MAG TPA: DNA polymerase III subunit gamma and tau [Mycobacteriales bacterium]|nr:DNA polymerase III subunit gamma and tau [Mycobacteriales bacterium]